MNQALHWHKILIQFLLSNTHIPVGDTDLQTNKKNRITNAHNRVVVINSQRAGWAAQTPLKI